MLKWLRSVFASPPNETVIAIASESVLTPRDWIAKWARANGPARVEQNESGSRYVRASFDLDGKPCRLVVYEFETGVHNVWLETPLPKAYGNFALMRFDVGDPPVAEEVDPDDDEIEPERIVFVSETTYLASPDSDAELARLLSIPEAERTRLIKLAEKHEAVTLADQVLSLNLGRFPGALREDDARWPRSQVEVLLAIGAALPRLKKKEAVNMRAEACAFCGVLTLYRPETPTCCRCGAPMQLEGATATTMREAPTERVRGRVYDAEQRARIMEDLRSRAAAVASRFPGSAVRESEPLLTAFVDVRGAKRTVEIALDDVSFAVSVEVRGAVGEFFMAHFEGESADETARSNDDDAHAAWRARESAVWFGKRCQLHGEDTEAEVARLLSLPEASRERLVALLDRTPDSHASLENARLSLGLGPLERARDAALLDAAIAVLREVADALPLDCESAEGKRLPLKDCDHCSARSFVTPRTKDCFACGAPLVGGSARRQPAST